MSLSAVNLYREMNEKLTILLKDCLEKVLRYTVTIHLEIFVEYIY